jgi:hypothetical protein
LLSFPVRFFDVHCSRRTSYSETQSFSWIILLQDTKMNVTPSFKAKIKCIPLCVAGSSFTHKATSREINTITSVYYNVSYYKNLLQVQNGLSSGKDTILSHADDRGFACLEEVFIKELIIF